MHGTHYLACEHVLLFGRAKRAARERASERLVSRVHFSLTISPKWRACSKATHYHIWIPVRTQSPPALINCCFPPQLSTQRTTARDDRGKAVTVEGVTSGSRKFEPNQCLGFINWLWHVNILLATNFKRPTDSLTSLEVRDFPLNS